MEDTDLYKAIQADDLEAVKEALEIEEDLDKQDSEGHSFLHVAVNVKASLDIFKALLEKVNIGVRDVNGQTVLDLVVAQSYSEEAVEAIKKSIVKLAEDDNTEKLLMLLMGGWNVWPITVEEAKQWSEDVQEFVEKLEPVQFKIARIHQAIEEGRLRDVKCLLDRKLLVTAADQTGLNALQKAVVFQQTDIVKFILGEFPSAVNLTGIMGRTGLHYAAGCEDDGNLYQLLIEANADENITDVLGKSPRDYLQNPEELSLSKIKETVLEVVDKTRPKELQSKTSVIPETAVPAPSQTSQTESEQTVTPPPSRKPVSMYISTDIYWKRNISPPNTIDGKYVARNLGTALTMALAEIAERRPWDPIEYLAQWLYKYRENIDYNKRQEDLLEEIRRDEQELEEEEKRIFRRKQEQKRIEAIESEKRRHKEEAERKQREYEELQEKIKEDARARVQSEKEKEERSMYKERDESGQTELHRLASQPGADLVALIDMNYSLADRDCFNKTPRDIAMDSNMLENVEIIDSYIGNMIEQEKTEQLQQLLLDGYGYDRLKAILDTVSTEGLPEVVTEFIATLPDLQEKITTLFHSVESGVLRDVAQSLSRRKLALAKDIYGRSPLHMAVLLEHKDIAEFIVKNVPITVKCRDNMNRTPLHYAMALSAEVAEFLQSNGADPEAQDVKKRLPSHYKEDKYEIIQLKETLKSEDTTDENAPLSSSQTDPSADEAPAEAPTEADDGTTPEEAVTAADDILE
ncbi:uncharacterized protein LOC121380929 [Gigantopelta aegis]|uniref:uncharacterized protein LOC121380929 n=1 Tax=Gigantopelta aegis TaxID=1735272 RepID=UPI001B88C957|nr:uncharacterized protein LOC121380929 [Gigantopelta aegis]XP_041365902.1 uncharacterized protein LOC121380929 [Gigantopelta aegis]